MSAKVSHQSSRPPSAPQISERPALAMLSERLRATEPRVPARGPELVCCLQNILSETLITGRIDERCKLDRPDKDAREIRVPADCGLCDKGRVDRNWELRQPQIRSALSTRSGASRATAQSSERTRSAVDIHVPVVSLPHCHLSRTWMAIESRLLGVQSPAARMACAHLPHNHVR